MHVHVGIEDDELRIDLMNQMRYFLPHLLMLSTSSPFWQGEDTGLKSYRLAVLDEMPRTGIPGTFESYGQYRRTIDVLVNAGVIGDATKIWWDLRPSDRFPTLEMRVSDVCPRAEDAVTIAALYVCITRMLYRLRRQNLSWRGYPLFLLEENRWRAQRYGVSETLFDFGKGKLVPFAELLDELLELVAEDAAALGCEDEVARARTIAREGTSADRQVAHLERHSQGRRRPRRRLKEPCRPSRRGDAARGLHVPSASEGSAGPWAALWPREASPVPTAVPPDPWPVRSTMSRRESAAAAPAGASLSRW